MPTSLLHRCFSPLLMAAALAAPVPAMAAPERATEPRASKPTAVEPARLDLGAAWPQRLSETGLYADGASMRLRSSVVAFSPQYPLWSDGAEKRRWFALPRGTAIDASRPDSWRFPAGTKLWKEFSVDGKPIETRVIERRADGAWTFATYVWNEAGTEAELAPARGTTLAVRGAPGGRYSVPGRGDCIACHGGAAVPVLGVGALQLSPDRDPFAPNAQPLRVGELDLRALVARGLVQGLPRELIDKPPRIPAGSATERAALGYLHANCSHCHHSSGGQVPVALTLAQSVSAPEATLRAVLASMLDAPSRYRPPGFAGDAKVVARGNPDAGVLGARMASRDAQVQMPPLGTRIPDPEGLALVLRWMTHDLEPRKEHMP